MPAKVFVVVQWRKASVAQKLVISADATEAVIVAAADEIINVNCTVGPTIGGRSGRSVWRERPIHSQPQPEFQSQTERVQQAFSGPSIYLPSSFLLISLFI